MRPRAIHKDEVVRGPDDLLRFAKVEAGQEYLLDPFPEVIWSSSDGSCTIEDLTQAAGLVLHRAVLKEEVFFGSGFFGRCGPYRATSDSADSGDERFQASFVGTYCTGCYWRGMDHF
jgi:hypothetical protein